MALLYSGRTRHIRGLSNVLIKKIPMFHHQLYNLVFKVSFRYFNRFQVDLFFHYKISYAKFHFHAFHEIRNFLDVPAEFYMPLKNLPFMDKQFPPLAFPMYLSIFTNFITKFNVLFHIVLYKDF